MLFLLYIHEYTIIVIIHSMQVHPLINNIIHNARRAPLDGIQLSRRETYIYNEQAGYSLSYKFNSIIFGIFFTAFNIPGSCIDTIRCDAIYNNKKYTITLSFHYTYHLYINDICCTEDTIDFHKYNRFLDRSNIVKISICFLLITLSIYTLNTCNRFSIVWSILAYCYVWYINIHYGYKYDRHITSIMMAFLIVFYIYFYTFLQFCPPSDIVWYTP